jgi:hypothetical protein
MTRGSKHEGAGGRPLKDPSGPAKMASFRLSPALLERIRAGAVSRGVSQADYLALAVEALDPMP